MEAKENITYDDVETFNFIIGCMMRIENKLETKLENNTSYTRYDIALNGFDCSIFSTNKLKNKSNQMELLLS